EGTLQVIFHGGEPFLRFPQIEQVVVVGEQMAVQRQKRIFFCGQTNLSLLTPQSIDFSLKHRIHWGFSLDGPLENNILRILKNGTATHERFEHALRTFPQFVRSCSVMATITSVNQSKLLDISRYFHSCGLRGWDWSLFQAIGRGRKSEIELNT